jgi:hypothetical protein
MTNPFPKPPSGSYKSILVQGLRNIGENKVADEFENGKMKLAIRNSIVGNVKVFPELQKVCEKALNSLEPTHTVRYYFWGIGNSEFVIASSNVDFIYDPTDKEAVEHNERMKRMSGNEIINPYFTT